MKPFVTLVIPTLNREQVLLETLQSLGEVRYPPDCWEIIVVDQTRQHEPGVEKKLEELAEQQKIRWFHPPEITFASLTKARNFGLLHGKNPDIVVFVDDDVEVKPDFLEQHVAAYADEKVGAVAGKTVVPGTVYPPPPFQTGKITWFGRFIDNFHGDEAGWVDNFVGCNFSLRHALVPTIGLFEEEFIANAMREDSDMAVRVREAGYHIRYLPEAGLLHKQTASGGCRTVTERMQWYFAFFHNQMLFYGKHAAGWRRPFFILHLWRPILACWLYYGKGSPKAFLQPWKGMASGWRAAQRASKKGKSVVKGRVQPVF